MSALPTTFDPSPGLPRDTAIDANRLTAYFGDKRVVDQLTLHVPRGSVFAFLGRNGSGKTTTIRMLLGLLPPTRGSSFVFGCDSRALTPSVRARVGYMSESHSLFDWMTVRQSGAFASRFYPRWNQRIFDSVVGHFRLAPGARAAQLSRGERAGLSLAITLAPEPELLILDDPAIGLDPVARRSLLESMIYVTRGADRTIFFSSHLLDDVERVADHVAVLDRSVLRATGSIEAIRAGVRQFVLRFDPPAAPPAIPALPPVRGLLHARRSDGELRLVVASPTDETRRALATLGAAVIDEAPVGFADAMTGYLGDRGQQGFFLDEPALESAGGTA
jgi:ABC-2 type transport system ATP-binding protein